jgi:SAM-dependent methyltransferase
VLDVACGTGIVARHAARRLGDHGTVTGIDRNAAMLSVARQICGDVTPAITWRRGNADDLPFEDHTFDVVLCQQGLQFFPAPEDALAEMHRVLTDGGRLGVGTCRPLSHQPGYHVLVDTLARHVGDAVARAISSPYTLGDLTRLGDLITAAGFGHLRRRIEITPLRVPSAEALLTVETTSSPVGAIGDRLDAASYRALVDDLTAGLAPHTDDDGVVFPFETAVVTATC